MKIDNGASLNDVMTLQKDEFTGFIQTCKRKNLPGIITIKDFTFGTNQNEADCYYINIEDFLAYMDSLTDNWLKNLHYLFTAMNQDIQFQYDYIDSKRASGEQIQLIRVTLTRVEDGAKRNFEILSDDIISNFIDMYYLGYFNPEFESLFRVRLEEILHAVNYKN